MLNSYTDVLIIVLGSWLWGGAVLAVHRHLKSNLTFLFVLLGAIATVIHLLNLVVFPTRFYSWYLLVSPYTLLPVLFLGLLVVYIMNGGRQAQGGFVGMTLAALIVVLVFLTLRLVLGRDGLVFSVPDAQRFLMASLVVLSTDVAILFVVYQFFTSLRNQFPSRLAGFIAILVATWFDAFVFPVLVFDEMLLLDVWQMQILMKSIATLAVLPLLVIYLNQYKKEFSRREVQAAHLQWDLFGLAVKVAPYDQSAIMQAAIDGMQDGLIISNLKGEILYVNAIVAEIAGLPTAEILRKTTFDFATPHQVGDFRRSIKRLLRYGSADLNFDYTAPDGTAFEFAANVALVRDENGRPKHIVSNVRDVTQQNRFRDQLLALNQWTTDLLPIHDPDLIFMKVLEICGELFQADASLICFPTAHAQDLTMPLASGLTAEAVSEIIAAYDSLDPKIWRGHAPLGIADVGAAAHRGLFGFLTQFHIRAALIFPIVIEDGLRGLLSVFYRQPQPFLQTEIQIGIALAQTLTILLQTAGLYRGEQENRQLVEALMQAATSLNSSLNLEEVVDHILEQAIRVVPCRSVNVMTLENQRLQLVRSKGYEGLTFSVQTLANLDDLLAFPIIKQLISEKKPLRIADTRQSSAWQITPSTAWIRSYIGVPLIYDNTILGLLHASSDEPDQFSENMVQRLVSFGSHAAVSIQNALQYERSRRRADQLAALMRANSAISSSLDFQKILEIVAEQLTLMLGIQNCAISAYHAETDTISLLYEHKAQHYPGEIYWSRSFELTNYPITKQIIQNGIPIQFRLSDPYLNQAEKAFLTSEDIRFLLMVPLLNQDQIIGLIELVDFETEHDFSTQNLVLVQTLATQIAIAIQNAQLFRNEQIQRELSDALTRAAAILNSSLEINQVFDQILRQLMRVIPCTASNIMMFGANEAYIHHHRGYEQKVKDPNFLKELRLPLDVPNIQSSLDGKPFLIANTDENPNWQQYPALSWVKGCAGVPLSIDHKIVGILSVDSEIPHFFTTETLAQLQTFAAHASTALRNAQLYDAILQRADEMTALANSAAKISSSIDMPEVTFIVAEQITRVMKAQACSILNFNPTQNDLSLIAQYGPEGWFIEDDWLAPLPLENYPLYQQVLRSHIPYQLEISKADPNNPEHQYMFQTGIKSLLILPLVVQDRAIGLIELIDDEIERHFSDHDILLGQTLASQSAVALQNADLYRQLQDHAADLEDRVQQRTVELQTAIERIQTILASVPDAVFVLDQAQNLVQANQAGNGLLIEAKQNEQNVFDPQFLKSLTRPEVDESQKILEINNRVYQALASEIEIEAGQQHGQVIVFRDVTRFKEIDQIKSQFISDVSHDLRTPLTNITLFLGFLEKEQSFSKRQTYSGILERETKRLTNLIDDLLAFSRLDLGKIEPNHQAININQLIHQLTLDRVMFASQNKIGLVAEPQPDLPLALGDPNWLTQTLSNLLTNAINYTLAHGKVTIRTGVRALRKQTWVVIDVIDTGVGIAPLEIDRIFERFYRGSASQKTNAPGTGLGLAISNEMVQKMGGEITVQSKLGQGSTFTVWLKPALLHNRKVLPEPQFQ